MVNGKRKQSPELLYKITHPRMRTKKSLIGMLFALPCAAVLLLMMISPLFRTIRYAFSEVTLPSFDSKWIGLDNFTHVINRQEFPTVIRNTIVWVIGSVILRFLFGMIAAMIMDGKARLKKGLRILALLPWTVPSIVAANSWRWMLQSDFGLINGMLKSIGLGSLARLWLSTPATALPTVLVVFTWAGFPFVMMMILSGLQNIPDELYEAGAIDGANKYQIFKYITIPSLRSVINVILALEVITALNAFDLLYVLTGGGPGTSSEILGITIYRLAFSLFNFAEASAASTLLIGLVVIGFLFYAPSQMAVLKRRKLGG